MDQINEDPSDVETLIEELGINDMDDDQLRQLQEYLDKALSENDSNVENGSESLFSDLCLDFATPSTSTKDSSSPMYQSPIRYKSKRRAPLRDVNNSDELRIDLPALDNYEKLLRSHDAETHDLLNEATKTLWKAHSFVSRIDKMAKETFGTCRPTSDLYDLPEVQEEQDSAENVCSAGTDEAVEPRSCNEPVPTEGSDDRQTFTVLDKRLRPVLAPAPGKTLYRHDPVTAINMYMEEWKLRPTPEEQKRLSLRWKIRDAVMNRRFVPKSHPTGEPVNHPKDWSPKPYLN